MLSQPTRGFKLKGAPAERAHVLKIMMRVALADGKISARERRRLERLAEAMEVGPAQYAELLVSVEQETLLARRSLRVPLLIAGGFLGVGLLIVLLITSLGDQETPAPDHSGALFPELALISRQSP